MNTLGADGWDLAGVQPLWPAETAYLMFKKDGAGDTSIHSSGSEEKAKSESTPATEREGAPTARLDNMPTQGSQGQGDAPTIIEA